MESTAKQLDLVLDGEESSKKIQDRIFETHTEELIIGLCGPHRNRHSFYSRKNRKHT